MMRKLNNWTEDMNLFSKTEVQLYQIYATILRNYFRKKYLNDVLIINFITQ